MAAYGPGTGAPPPPVNFAAPPPLPPPVASAGALVRRRAGRWTIEEETYARAIIAHFQTGKIDLEVKDYQHFHGSYTIDFLDFEIMSYLGRKKGMDRNMLSITRRD